MLNLVQNKGSAKENKEIVKLIEERLREIRGHLYKRCGIVWIVELLQRQVKGLGILNYL